MKNSSTKDEHACVKCGTCTTVCPVYRITGNEIYSPRGKQHLRSRIEKGETSAHYAEIFSKCLLCGACLEACPRGLDTVKLVEDVRAELPRLSGLSFLKYLSRKALTHPSLLTGVVRIGSVADKLISPRLPENSGLRLRLQGLRCKQFRLPATGYIEKLANERTAAGGAAEEMQPGSGMSFFVGCLANHMQPQIAEATQLLLAGTTGSRASVPVTQTCCGMAALAAGKIDEARDLARKNILAFEKSDAPILTSCSSCYYQLMSYRELFAGDREWQSRAVDFTERLREFSVFFLEKLAQESKMQPPAVNSTGPKVFYHDPCHLRFSLHITEEPRRLIRQLPGVELQELPDGPRCCGQGGLFQIAHPGLSRKLQKGIMDDFARISAGTVLTGCSGCLLQWQLGLAGGHADGRAEHLAVFIARLLL